jgi:hypothetical protein
MELYPFIKEGVINIFPEPGKIPRNENWASTKVSYLYKRNIWNTKEKERKGHHHGP